MAKSVLIVEDDEDIAELLALHLQDAGFLVTQARDGVNGLAKAVSEAWDLVLLDLNLPRLDGIEICQQVRQCNPDTPIIMVTARTAEQERIRGLDAGADDYVIKPFSVLELVARVRAIFRRMGNPSAPELQEVVAAGEIVLNSRTHEATLKGKPLNLTPREYDLLTLFVRSPGVVFKRQELLEKVWGHQHGVYTHTVNSHINRLRSKLDTFSEAHQYIRTVWGVGYKFVDGGE